MLREPSTQSLSSKSVSGPLVRCTTLLRIAWRRSLRWPREHSSREQRRAPRPNRSPQHSRASGHSAVMLSARLVGSSAGCALQGTCHRRIQTSSYSGSGRSARVWALTQTGLADDESRPSTPLLVPYPGPWAPVLPISTTRSAQRGKELQCRRHGPPPSEAEEPASAPSGGPESPATERAPPQGTPSTLSPRLNSIDTTRGILLPIVTGTARPGSSVMVTVGDVVTSVQADAEGKWLTPPVSVRAGSHAV